MALWTILPTSQQSRICSAFAFSRLASLVGFSLFLCFVGVGSDALASKPVLSRGLRYVSRGNSYNSGPIVSRVFYLSGSSNGDLALWPFLANYNFRYETSNGLSIYWPIGYSESNAPFVLIPQSASSSGSIPDTQGQEDLDKINKMIRDMPLERQAAIIGTNGFNPLPADDDNSFYTPVNFIYRDVGSVYSGGVVTYNSNGDLEVRFVESDGYVHGYAPVGVGQYEPVYFQVVGNDAVQVSYPASSDRGLYFNPDTEQYQFSIPDYTPIIEDISRNVESLVNNSWMVDLKTPIDVSVNPEITVNPPEVTVNPTVTVTPDVTVNVTSPTQNDITVAIDNSEVIGAINDVQQYIQEDVYAMRQEFLGLYPSQGDGQFFPFDYSPSTNNHEESSLLSVVDGWNTQIPVISNACNVAFNLAFGSVPSIPTSNLVPISGINVLGFDVTIDLRPYQSMFVWFRAFVLMLEVIWFIDSIWRTVTTALKV